MNSRVNAAVVLCLVLLVLGASSAADAQQVRRPNDGYHWLPGPNAGKVDDCLYHCGKGCSGSLNPCGGREPYWQLVLTSSPRTSGKTTESQCQRNGVGTTQGEIFERTVTSYRANGRWKFYGLTADLCQLHDQICRRYGGCWNPITYLDHLVALTRAGNGCSGARYRTWEHSAELWAWKASSWRPTGRSCTTDDDGIDP